MMNFWSNLRRDDKSRMVGSLVAAQILTEIFKSESISNYFKTSNFKSSYNLFEWDLETISSKLSKNMVDGCIFLAIENSHFTTSKVLNLELESVSFVTQNT